MFLLVYDYVLEFLGCLVVVLWVILGGILVELLFWLSFLNLFLVEFRGLCVGKGTGWTSLVRVSSHGERNEKRVECMGLYLPYHACKVEKL